MLSTDREDFDKLLAELFAGLDKPLMDSKRTAFWKALAVMSLIDFTRTVELMLQEIAQDGDKARQWHDRMTPSDVWAAKRRLRARGAVPSSQDKPEIPWTGDDWDIRANQLLLGYIADQARAGVHYCCEETRWLLRKASDPSEESRELTASLVAYKHAWARDMREIAARPNEVPKDVQLRAFLDCMKRADADVDQIREAYARERREMAA